MQTLGARAARLASQTGISLSETDELAGKTRGHWQAIVAGHVANPTLTTLSAYARVCGAAVGWLASGEGDAPTADAVRAAVERARAGASPTLRETPDAPSPALARAS